MATKYLYGAAVQGIQSFIFQTNELKDIVGASELVEQICTDSFLKQLKDLGISEGYNIILKAAGNIKCVFDKELDCSKMIAVFPKTVMEMASGITINQAVVSFDEGCFGEAVDILEQRLRTQRNKVTPSLTAGLMGIQRSRATGLPAFEKDGEDYYDKSVSQKKKCVADAHFGLCIHAFGKSVTDMRAIYRVDEISSSFKNNWIAVIHIDGNGLGQVVQKVGKNPATFKDFSDALDRSTKEAAQTAFEEVQRFFKHDGVIPIRPIVLGGDDFTVICRADFAMQYAESFIKAFETRTKEHLGRTLLESSVFSDGKDYLTACGGIAFIKSSYPFYYGYGLAEALCSEAKKDAKKGITPNTLPKACLMFHKVQDSFIQDFKEIEARELTPFSGHSWKFGPYYTEETAGRWTVDRLMRAVMLLSEDKDSSAAKSHMRRWMSEMHVNPAKAESLMKRAQSVLNTKKEFIKECTTPVIQEEMRIYPVYDILALNSVINLKTKEE